MKILVNKNILNGNPYLSGHNVTVLDIVSDCFYDGVNPFLFSAANLDISDLIDTFKYCESRLCDSDGSHCGGCSLRLLQDKILTMNDFINRFSTIKFIDSDEIIKGEGNGVMVMPGNKNTLHETWKGVKGWEMAEHLLRNQVNVK